jgi:hypothetical protein
MAGKDTRYAMIVLFMLFVFLIGGIIRASGLTSKYEWLRGIPQFAAALMLFTPIMFSIKHIMKKEFWAFRLITLGRIVVVLLDLSIVIMFLILGINSYSQ